MKAYEIMNHLEKYFPLNLTNAILIAVVYKLEVEIKEVKKVYDCFKR